MPLRLEPVRDRKLNRLVKAAAALRLRKSERLYEAGDPATTLFLVREGHVRLVLAGAPGAGGRTVEVAGPGELFGEEPLAGSGTRTYGAVAGEPSVVAPLDAPGVLRTLRTSAHTLTAFLRAREGDLLRARLGSGVRGARTRDRIALVLADLSERLGEKRGGGVRIGIRLTHQELAELAGAHRSTVTTVLNDWMYRGILRQHEAKLVVLRPERLRAGGT